eukprot:scaffold170_cov54-Isochrysis_galbana.AAC.1
MRRVARAEYRRARDRRTCRVCGNMGFRKEYRGQGLVDRTVPEADEEMQGGNTRRIQRGGGDEYGKPAHLCASVDCGDGEWHGNRRAA